MENTIEKIEEKRPPLSFLKVDEIIQRILGILILLTLIVYPIAMLLLMPFGAWQVISGIVGSLYGNKWRMKYIAVVVAYFSSYGLYALCEYLQMMNPVFEFILMTIYIATPLILGISYYVKTRKEAKSSEIVKPKWEDMDDILDLDMI